MEDKDLSFLGKCTNEQLKLLADFILFDKDSDSRWTESLSSAEEFKNSYPNNIVQLVPDIINEIQRFGGNSIANFLRGHGVAYREVLTDVCEKLKVPFNSNTSTELIELNLLRQILLTSIDKMNEEDVHHLADNLTKEGLLKQVTFIKAGSPLLIRLTTILVAQVAAKAGLAQATRLIAAFAGGRAFAVLAGPIGWVLSTIWAAFDIAGPAYRVTTPCVITIAYLRQIYDKSEDELNGILG